MTSIADASPDSKSVLDHVNWNGPGRKSILLPPEATPTLRTGPYNINSPSIMSEFCKIFVYSRACPSLGASVSHDLLLGRWRLSLDLFGRVFTEDVGLEPGSVVAELGGFPVKEVKFRRDMEKLRNSQQRDLTLHKVFMKLIVRIEEFLGFL